MTSYDAAVHQLSYQANWEAFFASITAMVIIHLFFLSSAVQMYVFHIFHKFPDFKLQVYFKFYQNEIDPSIHLP